jgi:hypothetical protein
MGVFGKLNEFAGKLYDSAADFVDYISIARNADGKGSWSEVLIGIIMSTGLPCLTYISDLPPDIFNRLLILSRSAMGVAGAVTIADYFLLNSGILGYMLDVPKDVYLESYKKNEKK